MATETLTLDHSGDISSRTALPLWDSSVGISVLGQSYPPPPHKVEYATSVDTEGGIPTEGSYENREIEIKVLVKAGSATFNANLEKLQQKVGLIQREGGYLRRVLSTGQTITFELTNAEIEIPADWQFIQKAHAEVTLKFEAMPFGKGTESTTTLTTETTLPVESHLVTGVDGDVPALGRLIVTDAQAVDQFALIWGLRQKNYSADVDAALFYEAEGRTAQGGSATAVGPTGASGAGSNVMRNTGLTTIFQSVCSTQATGGGSHLEHIGDYRVWARFQTPTTNTGLVTVALEWAEGDFRSYTQGDSVDLAPSTTDVGAWEGTWRLVNLGIVRLTKVVAGTQRWEGRFLAKSTVAGDDIDIDCFVLQPTTEGSGIARALRRYETPTSISARDEFDQAAGGLHGQTLPVGGTWDTNDGDATDASTSGASNFNLTRTATSDASGIGWYGLAGTTSYTNVTVQLDLKQSASLTSGNLKGPLARYADTNNWFAVGFYYVSIPDRIFMTIRKKVAGVVTDILSGSQILSGALTSFYTCRLQIDTSGWFGVWVFLQGTSPGDPIYDDVDSVLATSGALASGKSGIWDEHTSATALTRTYDNFSAAVPVPVSAPDAAIFASQSLEIRHDRAVREDSGGTLWVPVSSYEGDYCLIPPEGLEARTTEVVVKGVRNNPDTGADSAIDDISVQVGYTPRWLVVPEST